MEGMGDFFRVVLSAAEASVELWEEGIRHWGFTYMVSVKFHIILENVDLLMSYFLEEESCPCSLLLKVAEVSSNPCPSQYKKVLKTLS